MNEGKYAIGIITSPVCKAGITPLTNLIRIINNCSDKTYIVTGNDGRIPCDAEKEHMVVSSRNYSTQDNLLNRISDYIVLQLFTSVEILQHKKDISTWIFFLDAHALLLPVVIAKITKKKIIFIPAASIKKAAEAKKSMLLYLLSYSEMLTNRFADRIILYSNNLITEWNMDLHIQKIEVAPRHFLNFDAFTVTTKIQDRGDLIGFIGRFSEEKGVQNFAQALTTILNDREDLRVLIAGDGPLKDSIAASLQEGGITARVDFPGWISHDDLPNYLNQLRLLVLPSYTEGLPNIMLEAMACGTPVLATPVGAIPDVIIDGKTGFIMENNSPECIAANVVRALSSPDLERIAEAGRRFVEETFTFEKVVKNWKRILLRDDV
mgnify:CR=1 FL=1|jgi:glycosyltransferase involved in cell wall biosynthesis